MRMTLVQTQVTRPWKKSKRSGKRCRRSATIQSIEWPGSKLTKTVFMQLGNGHEANVQVRVGNIQIPKSAATAKLL